MVLHLQITVTVTVYEADERQSQISSITHDAARLLLPAVKLWKSQQGTAKTSFHYYYRFINTVINTRIIISMKMKTHNNKYNLIGCHRNSG